MCRGRPPVVRNIQMTQRTRNARPYKADPQKGTKMKCKNCNYDIPDGVKFCPLCGEKQDFAEGNGAPPPSPMYGYPPPYESIEDSPKYVGFGEAIALYFRNYVNFRTRSTRSEYWFAFLFRELIDICCWLIGFVIPGLTFIADAVFFLPNLSITYRRFHDTGRTGVFPLVRVIVDIVWKILVGGVFLLWLAVLFRSSDLDIDEGVMTFILVGVGFLGIVPLGLKIYEIVICCFDSQHEPNQYGREPRY